MPNVTAPIGFNFRQSLGAATDVAPDVAVLANAGGSTTFYNGTAGYGIRSDVDFGNAGTAGTSGGTNAKISGYAGIGIDLFFQFRVDTGNGNIALRMAVYGGRVRVYDGAFTTGKTPLLTVGNGGYAAAGNFDATNVDRSNWVTQNQPATVVCTQGFLTVRVGGTTAEGNTTESGLRHFAIDSISAPPVLSSATGTGGVLTATGSVSTTQGSGTLWSRLDTGTAATDPGAGNEAAAGWQSQPVTATGAQAVSFGAQAAGTRFANYLHVTTAGRSSVARSGSFTILSKPALSSPTRNTPSGTSAYIGFTTDGVNGTARGVLTTSPTQPSAVQAKAGQDASGGTSGVVALAALSIGSAGAKVFDVATVTSGLTYYAWVVHTNADNVDSDVLAVGAIYPGTGRPVADVGPADGWSASSGGDLSAMLREDVASDSTFVTSPTLTGAYVSKDFDLSQPYPPGTYENLRIRARVPGGTGTARFSLLSAAGAVLASSAEHALTGSFTTFTTPSVTLAGTATRFRIEVKS